MSIAETANREPPSKRKEELDGQDGKPKSHEMGLQVPRGVHTEMSKKDAVPGAAKAPGGGVSDIGESKREPDRRGASDAGPCAHDAIDTAEIRGVAGGGIHQGQERDPSGQGICRTQKEFCRPTLLGARVLCFDGGTRRRGDSQLHKAPRGGGREIGTAWVVEVAATE